jgi:hypothetical protein
MLELNDEELALLQMLAEPVAYGQRAQFLREVAAALETCQQTVPGVIHRVAAQIQREFVVTSQRVSERESAPTSAQARA